MTELDPPDVVIENSDGDGNQLPVNSKVPSAPATFLTITIVPRNARLVNVQVTTLPASAAVTANDPSTSPAVYVNAPLLPTHPRSVS